MVLLLKNAANNSIKERLFLPEFKGTLSRFIEGISERP
jgi:hypothetical protein